MAEACRPSPGSRPVIFCSLLPETKDKIKHYVAALKAKAPTIGDHGLSTQEFWDSGLFRAAIESIRGTQVATMSEKRDFAEKVLGHLKSCGRIKDWRFEGQAQRHDYHIEMLDDRLCVVEAKGCLDGNNTNIFVRPPNADEFVIWSLCQNMGADPRKNVWSGVHTRLSAEVIARRQQVDGLIVWDGLCGTALRPCPKLVSAPSRASPVEGLLVPPPCLYLFPRSIPDPRDNPCPPCRQLGEVHFLKCLWDAFKGDEGDVVEVRIEARMDGPNRQRRTTLSRMGSLVRTSDWVDISRAQ